MNNITITLTPEEVQVWELAFDGFEAIQKKVAMELAVKQFAEQYPAVSRTVIRKAVRDIQKERRQATEGER